MNILITGGASGLGEAITKKLASDKSNQVIITFNNSLENATRLKEEFDNVLIFKCDFKDINSVNAFVEEIKEFDLDVLINNAFSGDYLKSHFHKVKAEDFLEDFEHNIMPVIKITQEVIKIFRKKKAGKIITVLSSVLSNRIPIGASVYAANKSYLSLLTKVWASENAKFNITSNSVSPSFMETKLTSGFDERLIEKMISEHPLKEILKVNEVAEAVHFLLNASPHVNGIDLKIDSTF